MVPLIEIAMWGRGAHSGSCHVFEGLLGSRYKRPVDF